MCYKVLLMPLFTLGMNQISALEYGFSVSSQTSVKEAEARFVGTAQPHALPGNVANARTALPASQWLASRHE
jgi:hypothetical protein